MRQIRWAVRTTARLVPWRALCFETGLATHQMLRRRGISSALHYGVRHAPDGKLGAHVWVSVRGHAVIGGEVAPDFACLATYPTAS